MCIRDSSYFSTNDHDSDDLTYSGTYFTTTIPVRGEGAYAVSVQEVAEDGTALANPNVEWFMPESRGPRGWTAEISQTRSMALDVSFSGSNDTFPSFETAHCEGVTSRSEILEKCYETGGKSPWTTTTAGTVAEIDLAGVADKNVVVLVRGVYADGARSGFEHHTRYVFSRVFGGLINGTVVQDHDGTLHDRFASRVATDGRSLNSFQRASRKIVVDAYYDVPLVSFTFNGTISSYLFTERFGAAYHHVAFFFPYESAAGTVYEITARWSVIAGVEENIEREPASPQALPEADFLELLPADEELREGDTTAEMPIYRANLEEIEPHSVQLDPDDESETDWE